ncbi:MAG: ATP-binding protein [Candidatus Competibacterales bacterium]
MADSIEPSTPLIQRLVAHVEQAPKRVGCENACIHLLSRDRRRLICQAISDGLRATHLAYGLDLSACLAASEIFASKQPLAIDDAVNDPRVAAVARRRFGLQSITYCPILVDGDPRGMMTFSYNRHHRWSERQVAAAQATADACGQLLKDNALPSLLQPPSTQDTLLRAMLDATPGIVLAVDRHLLTLDANTTLVANADLFDGGGDDPVRLSIQELIQSTDRDYDLRQAIDDILSGELGRYEALVQIRGRYWNLLLKPLLNLQRGQSLVTLEATAIPGLVLSGADVTLVMQARSVMEANQHMTALGRLSASVSHEFNNLLQILQGQVDQLQQVVAREDLAADFDQLQATVGRGAKLARQLLTFARPEDAVIQPLDLIQRLANWWTLLQNATGRDRRLSLHIRHPVQVMADADQLELVLVNLIINARDATQPGDTIELHVDRLEEAGLAYGTLAVVDHGEGMLPQVLARATEPFFTTKPQGKGTGLGLATAQRIAESQGGRLTLTSEVGKGTTVSLFLPLAQEGRTTPAATPPPKAYTALAQGSQRGRIVVVDDEQAICGWVKRSLEAAGHQVKTATSGEVFAHLMAQDPHWPEVILLDMTLQDTTGLALFRRFRPHHPTLGWIVASGYADNADIQAIAQEGFKELTKPFDGAQLRLAVERALAARRLDS